MYNRLKIRENNMKFSQKYIILIYCYKFSSSPLAFSCYVRLTLWWTCWLAGTQISWKWSQELWLPNTWYVAINFGGYEDGKRTRGQIKKKKRVFSLNPYELSRFLQTPSQVQNLSLWCTQLLITFSLSLLLGFFVKS